MVMNKKKEYPKAIRNWPEEDRPREKLLKYGSLNYRPPAPEVYLN
jgi:hypothetical protein